MRFIAVLLPIVAIFGTVTAPVFAQADPDNLTVERELAARNLLEDGDLLVIIEYNIAYTTAPSDTADINFVSHLRNSSDEIIGSDTPYPFNDNGYGKGIMSFYLSEDETASEGFTDGSGSYNSWPVSDLDVVIQGNPAKFTPVPSIEVTLTSGDYTDGSTTTTNLDQLATEIKTIAGQLEAAWQVDLLSESGRLNSTGSEYVVVAIPEARRMAPSAFSIITTSPTFPTPQPTPGGSGTLAETAETRFDGTFWITPALERLSGDFGLPDKAMPGFATFLVMLTTMGLFVVGAEKRDISAQKALTAGFIVCLVVILPTSMLIGWVPWQWGILVLGFVSVAAVIKVVFNWMR